jgi:hypothetical protein
MCASCNVGFIERKNGGSTLLREIAKPKTVRWDTCVIEAGLAGFSSSTTLLWFGVPILCVVIWIRYRKFPTFSFIYTVLLLIVVGSILLLTHVPYINDDFSRALGHAFIIAAILAATVDHYVKERVLREVSLDVSKYLVGYRLPEEVQDRIRDLMQSKWIRRKFEVRVGFSETAGGKKIKGDVHISEEIQNITSEHLEYQDIIEFEKHEPVTLLEMQCDSEDAGSSYHLTGQALKDLTTESGGRVITTGKRVRIPPAAQAIGRFYRFRARYELIQPTKFSELISFTLPTIGVSIEITDAPENYQFHLTPAADLIGHHRWEYKRLFLPGEHVTIIWERVDGQTKKV